MHFHFIISDRGFRVSDLKLFATRGIRARVISFCCMGADGVVCV